MGSIFLWVHRNYIRIGDVIIFMLSFFVLWKSYDALLQVWKERTHLLSFYRCIPFSEYKDTDKTKLIKVSVMNKDGGEKKEWMCQR